MRGEKGGRGTPPGGYGTELSTCIRPRSSPSSSCRRCCLQGGRKHTTHVAGLAPYRLAPERVAREAARAFAAAGTTGPCATDPGVTEAVLQVRGVRGALFSMPPLPLLPSLTRLQGEWGPGVIDLLAAPPPAGFGLPRRVLSWEGEGGGGGRHKAR